VNQARSGTRQARIGLGALPVSGQGNRTRNPILVFPDRGVGWVHDEYSQPRETGALTISSDGCAALSTPAGGHVEHEPTVRAFHHDLRGRRRSLLDLDDDRSLGARWWRRGRRRDVGGGLVNGDVSDLRDGSRRGRTIVSEHESENEKQNEDRD